MRETQEAAGFGHEIYGEGNEKEQVPHFFAFSVSLERQCHPVLLQFERHVSRSELDLFLQDLTRKILQRNPVLYSIQL